MQHCYDCTARAEPNRTRCARHLADRRARQRRYWDTTGKFLIHQTRTDAGDFDVDDFDRDDSVLLKGMDDD
jgi:hypothetical protein